VFIKAPAGGLVAGVGGMVDGAQVRIGPAAGQGSALPAGPLFDGRGNPLVESLRMEIPKATMARFAATLTMMVDPPVVDRTGLTGTYAIGLDLPSQSVIRAIYMPMPGRLPRSAPPADEPASGSIFQSIQSLGLRLEKDKAAIETIVVEHIER